METVRQNLAQLRLDIQQSAQACGRTGNAVQLVAVSKTQPEAIIVEALGSGQRLFGENRVREALERWTLLKPQWPDIQLHLIGPLQTNKAAEAVRLFDCIETIDRRKVAVAVADEMKKQGRAFPCMVQVNTGNEPQKAGASPEKLSELLDFCHETGLQITGLMCIPPHDEPPALHFALLKKLAGRHALPHLSMGMSADYAWAIPLGATHIRLGTAVFGARNVQ